MGILSYMGHPKDMVDQIAQNALSSVVDKRLNRKPKGNDMVMLNDGQIVMVPHGYKFASRSDTEPCISGSSDNVNKPKFATHRHAEVESTSDCVATPVPEDSLSDNSKIAGFPLAILDDAGMVAVRTVKPERGDGTGSSNEPKNQSPRPLIYNGEWGGLLGTGKRGWAAVPLAYRKSLRSHVSTLYETDGLSVPIQEQDFKAPDGAKLAALPADIAERIVGNTIDIGTTLTSSIVDHYLQKALRKKELIRTEAIEAKHVADSMLGNNKNSRLIAGSVVGGSGVIAAASMVPKLRKGDQ